MTTRRHLPFVTLSPETYEAWLKENPKEVSGGPIRLMPNLDSDDKDNMFFEAYVISSEELPEHYKNNLIIFGNYNEYEGFKIWVTPENYDYLLMAHQTHNGPFISTDGRTFGNHPHFHELDYYKSNSKPVPRRQVPSNLKLDMSSYEILKVFMEYYFIDDGRDGVVRPPDRPSKRQKELHEFK